MLLVPPTNHASYLARAWPCPVQPTPAAAFALICDYVTNTDPGVRAGAVLGLGLAYAGTRREEVRACWALVEHVAPPHPLGGASAAGLAAGDVASFQTCMFDCSAKRLDHPADIASSPNIHTASANQATIDRYSTLDPGLPVTMRAVLIQPPPPDRWLSCWSRWS
jgi:hypothetical protein